MEATFWHQKWEKGETAFHEAEPNPLLMRHWDGLSLAEGSRVFVPLCGKTRDIGWLHGRGHRIVGVELSEIPVAELFEEMAIVPKISQSGTFTRYSSERLEVLVGDFFALSSELLGEVDAVYDRGALVALPAELRPTYATHLLEVTGARPQLLVTLHYEAHQLEGPPFLVESELESHYGSAVPLERRQIPGGLRGGVKAWETLWQVKPADAKAGKPLTGARKSCRPVP